MTTVKIAYQWNEIYTLPTVQIAWNATLFYVCESKICEYNCLEYEYIASPDTSTKNARTSTLLRVYSSRESKNMHKYCHESRSMTRIIPRASRPCTREYTRKPSSSSREAHTRVLFYVLFYVPASYVHGMLFNRLVRIHATYILSFMFTSSIIFSLK